MLPVTLSPCHLVTLSPEVPLSSDSSWSLPSSSTSRKRLLTTTSPLSWASPTPSRITHSLTQRCAHSLSLTFSLSGGRTTRSPLSSWAPSLTSSLRTLFWASHTSRY